MYVYSTASADNRFHLFHEQEEGKPARVKHSVVVRGKANVVDRALITPQGVATKITKEQAELLEKHPVFQQMVEAKFMKLDAKKYDPEEVAKNELEGKDGAAPMVEEDLKKKAGQSDEVKLHDMEK